MLLGDEAGAAAERGLRKLLEHEHEALTETIALALAADAVDAAGAAAALERLASSACVVAADVAVAPKRGGVDSGLEYTRRYARTIAMPGEAKPLDVLYEDDDILVVNKPAGLSVHPRHRFEAGALLNRAVAHLGGRAPNVVHRLDHPTSGVLVLGKSTVAASGLAKQFRERKVSKSYLAVTCAPPPDESAFEVDAPIARHPTDSKLSVVPSSPAEAEALNARPSLTRFEVLELGPTGALCLASPVSGRMHQIRVHAELSGCPLAGDSQYGLQLQPTPPCARLLLHAHSLELMHPTAYRRVRFVAAPPLDFLQTMRTLGFGGLSARAAASILSPEAVVWLDPADGSCAAT